MPLVLGAFAWNSGHSLDEPVLSGSNGGSVLLAMEYLAGGRKPGPRPSQAPGLQALTGPRASWGAI